MKTRNLLFLALLAPAIAFGQANARPDFISLQILQNDDLVFPTEASLRGIREGSVKLALQVDADGKLQDVVLLSYTAPEFVDTTLSAVKRWSFVPAKYRGENRGVVTHIEVRFEERGIVVVRMDISHTVDELMNRIRGMQPVSNISKLSSLDRIPVPKTVLQPYLPSGYKGRARVVVEFFIDESGKVRMPCVISSDDDDLSVQAVEAVRQWSFESPTSKGKATMVRAQQTFEFQGK